MTKSENEKDINDIFSDLLLSEENLNAEGFHEGYIQGHREGSTEGFHLGYHRGAEIGAELGYYMGIIKYHLKREENLKITQLLTITHEYIKGFPKDNNEEVDIISMLDDVRALMKKLCVLLKINPIYPERDQLSF